MYGANSTRRVQIVVGGVLITVMTASARAQTQCNRPVGPDVIVGDIQDLTSYGSVGNISGFAVGTTSCNVGNQNLQWVATTNQHPVIAQNMYQLKNDRFQQIGMSWLKHGFLALTGNFCQCGCNGQGGTVLGVGCSDPYSSGLNGIQGSMGTGGLGPRFEVNAHTGGFQFPYTYQGMTGNAIYKRLQVNNSDLDPAQDGGGLYFVEGHYVSPDDAATGNQNNNASYRKVRVSWLVDTWTISVEDTTRQEQAAIRAWQDNDPTVSETDVQVQNDGLFVVAAKATPLPNGHYRYEYAVYNMNSDRSARSFSVPIVAGAIIENLYFHDVDYHSGDGIGGVNYDGTNWTASVSSTSVTWSTETFAQNESANALRWGTLYNFAFDADLVPDTIPGPATIGLFKPAAPTEVDASTVVPSNDIVGVTFWLPDGVPASLPPNVPVSFDVSIIPVNETVVVGSPTLHYRYDSGAFLTKPLLSLVGQLYQATLPPAECGDAPEFYLSAVGDGGSTATSPLGAPPNYYSAVMGDLIYALADNFETDQGWTVENVNVITGAWERGVPAGGGDLRDPPTDFDGSGQCYVTGIIDGNFDLDGGPTRLISPILDLSEALDPTLEFARWYNSSGFGDDPLFVEISNNDGASWTSVIGVYFGTNWAFLSFRIADFVTPNEQVRLRFTVQDNPDNSITEVGIDAVVVRDFRCVPLCIKGDMNDDAAVDGRDIDWFVQVVASGTGTPVELCAGDIQAPADGQVSFDDLDEFVNCLLASGCP
jgi:hypothetical protein